MDPELYSDFFVRILYCKSHLKSKFNNCTVFYAVFILDEPSAFYAEEIYDAVSGEGTNDRKLIQIFLKRSEVPAKYAASRF